MQTGNDLMSIEEAIEKVKEFESKQPKATIIDIINKAVEEGKHVYG